MKACQLQDQPSGLEFIQNRVAQNSWLRGFLPAGKPTWDRNGESPGPLWIDDQNSNQSGYVGEEERGSAVWRRPESSPAQMERPQAACFTEDEGNTLRGHSGKCTSRAKHGTWHAAGAQLMAALWARLALPGLAGVSPPAVPCRWTALCCSCTVLGSSWRG